MKKAIGASIAVLALTLFAVSVALADDVPATVTIQETCGFSIDGNLNFLPPVIAGSTSNTLGLTLTNTGSLPATVSLSGTPWTSGPNSMPVGQTLYGDPSPITPLTGLPTALPAIGNLPSNTLVENFQMSVPAGQAAGAYAQTITFTVSCDQQ